MVDTLLRANLPKYDYQDFKITTEPDNGHKTESLIKLDYTNESDRLQSFVGFESDSVRPQDLAKAGFYFLNDPNCRDLVKCAFCAAEIGRWEDGDVPLQEHLRWSPNCRFVKQLTNNRNSLSFLNNPAGQDVCGNAEIFNSVPENETFRLLNSMLRNNFDDESSRLESFKNWPQRYKQKPEDLAAAGFFYTGVDDHTICYACGNALREWEDSDDPWEQHALYFPRCKHLINKKGSEFIAEVQRKLKPTVPSSETKEKECQKSASEESSRPSNDDGLFLCKICDRNERNIIFIPCRHVLACDKCSEQFDKCPVCREWIKEKLKVFIS